MQYYKPLKVELIYDCGEPASLHAMLLPKNQTTEKTYQEKLKLARRLILAGDSHAKFSRGILYYIKAEMQAGFMIELETYRHGIECLSTSSSMHNELKGLSGYELAEQKQADLSRKVYTRIFTASAQALRNIYKQRRTHRHPDWQIFCDFIEDLDGFTNFIYPENYNKKIGGLDANND